MSGFTARDVPPQWGRCFMITGANTGVGFAAAKVLAERGARVLLACRSRSRAEAAMARIRQSVPDADLAFCPLDLADLDSVREAARIAAQEPRLDVLVNNAGACFPALGRTEQGFELHWGVNYLAPFALTGLLWPKLAETPGSRIVVTSSVTHWRGRIDWDDLDARKRFRRKPCYAASKLANLLHVHELDRRLRAIGSPVAAVACHPGVAVTDIARHNNLLRPVFPLAGLVFNSAAQGAWPTLQAATAPDIARGGFYGPRQLVETRGPSAPARRSARARDAGLARKLWDVSVQMTGIDPELRPA